MHPLIKTYFRRYDKMRAWSFCFIISIENIIISWLLAILSTIGLGLPDRTDLIEMTDIAMFVNGSIIASLVETLLFQSFPVMLGRVLGLGMNIQFLLASIPFAFLHFLPGIASGICAGIIGGFYLGYIYVYWRQISFWKAFGITSGVHCLTNTFWLLLDLLFA